MAIPFEMVDRASMFSMFLTEILEKMVLLCIFNPRGLTPTLQNSDVKDFSIFHILLF